MNHPQKPSELPFADKPFSQEIFAEEAFGFHLLNGIVTVTLTSKRANHATNPALVSRVVVGRVAMPLLGAQAYALSLYNFLKKNGFDPSGKIEGQTTQ